MAQLASGKSINSTMSDVHFNLLIEVSVRLLLAELPEGCWFDPSWGRTVLFYPRFFGASIRQ
jgi:hypothetical protein